MIIEKKVDIVGLLGFLLGLGAAVWHVLNYFVGPDVHLFAPPQVLLKSYDFGDGSPPIVRISAPMSYANEGEAGNNATIESEQVSFAFRGKEVVQRWQEVHRVTTTEDGSLKFLPVGDAHPVPIVAGSAISREIYFSPFPERCASDQPDCNPDQNYVNMADFAKTLQVGTPLVLTFSSCLLGDPEPLVQRCEIDVTPTLVNDLETVGWFSAPCWTSAAAR